MCQLRIAFFLQIRSDNAISLIDYKFRMLNILSIPLLATVIHFCNCTLHLFLFKSTTFELSFALVLVFICNWTIKAELSKYDATRLRQLYTGFRFNTPFTSKRIDIWKPVYTINTGTLAVQRRLRLVWQLLLLFCSLLGVAEQGITYSLNKNNILIVGKLCRGRSQLRSQAQQMYE